MDTIRFYDDPNRSNLVHLKDITQTYNNGQTVVIDGFELLIEATPNKGRFIVIMGASGCGKSTVLRYLAGLQTPTAGQVLIKDEPRNGKHIVPMVFQDYTNYPWLTVRENISLPLEIKTKLGRGERDQRVDELIEVMNLKDQANKYAQMPGLSGGQMQRVAIARALATYPELILMDEPFGALDIKTRLKLQLFLADLWMKIKSTIIFVTHDPAEAVFLADDIYFMAANPGRIVKHIPVYLPDYRTWETRRTPQFRSLTDQVEDTIRALE